MQRYYTSMCVLSPTGGFTAVLVNNFMTQALTEFAKIGLVQ